MTAKLEKRQPTLEAEIDVRRESSRFLSDRLQKCSLQIAGKTPPPKKQPAVVLLGFGLSRVRLATLQAWLVDG